MCIRDSVRTFKNEVVSFPNSLVLSTSVTNYSRLARESGLTLYTTVTIGYDVPWQQVQELLIGAALDTADILKEPSPFVLQKGLNDFNVSYELNALTRKPELLPALYSVSYTHLDVYKRQTHARVRRELWGYAADEALDNDDLIAEQYRGIRPAPGYPSCPDHTEKGELFRVLDATDAAGIHLTESFAMLPAASVSGYYFAHPQAAYFGLGRIGRDQVEEYAARKGMSVEWVERWLASSLGY